MFDLSKCDPHSLMRIDRQRAVQAKVTPLNMEYDDEHTLDIKVSVIKCVAALPVDWLPHSSLRPITVTSFNRNPGQRKAVTMFLGCSPSRGEISLALSPFTVASQEALSLQDADEQQWRFVWKIRHSSMRHRRHQVRRIRIETKRSKLEFIE